MDDQPKKIRLDRRTLLQIGGMVLVGSGASLWLRNSAAVGEDVGDRPTVQAIRADQSAPKKPVAGADVTIIAFNDYNCAACRSAHPRLDEARRQDGRSEMVYREWPIFGPRSERAARVALAARYQDIYVPVHERLMTQPDLSEAGLRSAVVAAGGSWERIARTLSTRHDAIEQQLATNRRQAFAMGLQGTPAFLIGPILVRGAVSAGAFERTIAEARALSQQTA